jgi:Uma2 family endonuclease
MAPAHTITDEELLQLPSDGSKYEVVDGELIVSPAAGLRHARAVMRLTIRLGSFVEAHRLGDVLGWNTLFLLPSGNRRHVGPFPVDGFPQLTAPAGGIEGAVPAR